MAGLAWPAVFLYAGGICWTIGYDTIYALQDIEDDLIAGVKSTALRFGSRVREAVGLFYVVAFGLIGVALFGRGRRARMGACRLARPRRAFPLADCPPRSGRPPSALRVFRSNRDAGLIFAAGLAVQALL